MSSTSQGRRRFVSLIVGGSVVGVVLVLLGLEKHQQSRRTSTRNPRTIQANATPRTSGSVSIEETLAKRRSIREYADEPLGIGEVMQLFWAAQGITQPEYGFRTAPSAGGTYPLEIYLVARHLGVTGLEAGIYRYEPKDHTLVKIIGGDFGDQLMAAALDQEWVGAAPANFVITAVFERTTAKYGERGVRYVWQETGHAAQNIYLQTVALGLGNVVVGAFDDTEVQRILQLPELERPMCVIPIGVLRTA